MPSDDLPPAVQIFSLTNTTTPVGINGRQNPPPDTQPVQIGDTYDNAWYFTPIDPNANTYQLRNTQYLYTGVVDNIVSSVTDQSQDLQWVVTEITGQSGYTIAQAGTSNPTLGWTASPSGEIANQPLADGPPFVPAQLFTKQ